MNGRGTDLRATPLRPPGGRRNETGMLPLINIVLLLLIFFLIAGRVADVQDRGDIRPPTSASDEPVRHPPVTLALGPRGRLTLNGTDVSFETAGPALHSALAADDPRVALKVDRDVTAETLDALLDVVRAQGVATLTLYSVNAEAA